MKTYSVYHLPQFIHPDGRIGKVGCTSYDDPRKRAIEQSYTFNDFEVLEEHTDGWLAGDREKELQKEYGYPVDKNHYMTAKENRRKFTKEDMAKGGRTNAESGHLDRIQHLAQASRLEIVECPKCGKKGAKFNMKRYHFDNCALA